MSFSIKVNNARFDNDKVLSSLTLPSLQGLSAEFIIATSLAASQRNLNTGLDELTEIAIPSVGPTWNADSATFICNAATESASGLQATTNATNAEGTHIVVAEKAWGAAAVFTGGSNGFYGVSSGSYCVYATGAYAGVGRRAQIAQSALPSGFIVFIGRGQSGGLGKLSAGVSGSLLDATATNVDGAITAGALKVAGSTAGTGTVKVAYAAHYSRVLTDEECLTAYLSLKAFFTARGVTIS